MTTATTMTTNSTNTTEIATDAAAPAKRKGMPESELRAAARKKGLSMKELAALMGVSASHLSQVGTGKKPWTPNVREKAIAVLGEVPGQGVVYRQGGEVTSESSFIRERAREIGMVRRLTVLGILDSIGRDSEEVPGPTDPPQSESLGGQQHVGKGAPRSALVERSR